MQQQHHVLTTCLSVILLLVYVSLSCCVPSVAAQDPCMAYTITNASLTDSCGACGAAPPSLSCGYCSTGSGAGCRSGTLYGLANSTSKCGPTGSTNWYDYWYFNPSNTSCQTARTIDRCLYYSGTCGTCVSFSSASECGYCSLNHLCVRGNFSGSAWINCTGTVTPTSSVPNFKFGTCDPVILSDPCYPSSGSCSNCQARAPECGYCNNNGNLNGRGICLRGNYYGFNLSTAGTNSCPPNKWYYSQCISSVSALDPCTANADCKSCALANCGWCRTPNAYTRYCQSANFSSGLPTYTTAVAPTCINPVLNITWYASADTTAVNTTCAGSSVCAQYTTLQQCCLAPASAKCGWCSQTNQCASGSSYGPTDMSVCPSPPNNWYFQTCSGSPYSDYCVYYGDSCSSCMSAPSWYNCGWCDSRNNTSYRCAAGNSTSPLWAGCGTINNTFSQWWPASKGLCQIDVCSQYSSCPSCTSNSACGWCASGNNGLGQCMIASNSNPSLNPQTQSCLAWFYGQCNSPTNTDSCSTYNSGCNLCHTYGSYYQCGICVNPSSGKSECRAGTPNAPYYPGDFNCTLWRYYDKNDMCTDPCAAYTNCSSCSAAPTSLNCGWCSSSGACMSGNSYGAVGFGTCYFDWRFNSSESVYTSLCTSGTSCSTGWDCDSCTTMGNCQCCSDFSGAGTCSALGSACGGSSYSSSSNCPSVSACSSYGDCASCHSVGYSSCQWCGQTGSLSGQCQGAATSCSASFYSFPYYSTCPSSSSSSDPCAPYSDSCDSCASNTQYQCGWCPSAPVGSQCQIGYNSGPIYSQCPSGWSFKHCATNPCGAYTSCATCTQQQYCGWCDTYFTCMDGSFFGTYGQSFCPSYGWNYQTCNSASSGSGGGGGNIPSGGSSDFIIGYPSFSNSNKFAVASLVITSFIAVCCMVYFSVARSSLPLAGSRSSVSVHPFFTSKAKRMAFVFPLALAALALVIAAGGKDAWAANDIDAQYGSITLTIHYEAGVLGMHMSAQSQSKFSWYACSSAVTDSDYQVQCWSTIVGAGMVLAFNILAAIFTFGAFVYSFLANISTRSFNPRVYQFSLLASVASVAAYFLWATSPYIILKSLDSADKGHLSTSWALMFVAAFINIALTFYYKFSIVHTPAESGMQVQSPGFSDVLAPAAPGVYANSTPGWTSPPAAVLAQPSAPVTAYPESAYTGPALGPPPPDSGYVHPIPPQHQGYAQQR